jgi:hypothetical protein
MKHRRLLELATIVVAVSLAAGVLLVEFSRSRGWPDKVTAALRHPSAKDALTLLTHGAFVVGLLGALNCGGLFVPVRCYSERRLHWAKLGCGEQLWFGGGVGAVVCSLVEVAGVTPAKWSMPLLLVGIAAGFTSAFGLRLVARPVSDGVARSWLPNLVGWIVSAIWLAFLVPIALFALMAALGIG